MDLQLIGVLDRGVPHLECVHLKVVNDCNLDRYMVCDTTYLDQNTMSNKLRHQYWFAHNNHVKFGSHVLLYSSIGTDKTAFYNGVSFHTFYWNLEHQIWNNTGDRAVLFQLAAWQSVAVNTATLRKAA